MSEETKTLYDQVAQVHERGGLSEEDFAIQQKVDAALDTAVNENGYEEICTWTDMILANDLIENSSEFEDFSPARLRPFVKSWQERHGGDCIEVKWTTGPNRKETLYVPRAALAMAETQLIARLTEYGNSWRKRANSNALETLSLGRQLSINMKALEAMRGVLVAVQQLRRFGSADADNPVGAAMQGFIALQDGKQLDEAVEKAAKALIQLDKEYPTDEPTREV